MISIGASNRQYRRCGRLNSVQARLDLTDGGLEQRLLHAVISLLRENLFSSSDGEIDGSSANGVHGFGFGLLDLLLGKGVATGNEFLGLLLGFGGQGSGFAFGGGNDAGSNGNRPVLGGNSASPAGSYDTDTAFGLEAAFAMGPASIQGEYITRKTKADDNAFDDIKGHGFYVQGAYTLTGESRGYKVGKFDAIKPQNKSIGAWEVFYRYDSLTVEDDNITAPTLTRDVGDAEAKVHTLGVNWYANEAVKISAAYLNAKTEKVTNATAASGGTPAQRTGDDSGDGFVVRAQYVF